jgi:Holliday junction resolvase RusA-like endonuclease
MTAPLLSIRVLGTPRPKGSMRHVGNGRMIEQLAGSGDWRQDVITTAHVKILGRDGFPYAGPVVVDIVLEFRPPKKPGIYPHTRSSGDIDKHARNILDALQDAGVIKDDAAVVNLRVAKRWAADAPGARITLYPAPSIEEALAE